MHPFADISETDDRHQVHVANVSKSAWMHREKTKQEQEEHLQLDAEKFRTAIWVVFKQANFQNANYGNSVFFSFIDIFLCSKPIMAKAAMIIYLLKHLCLFSSPY